MKLKAIILTAMILVMSLATCSAEKILPAASMEKMCKAFLYLDETELKDLNSSSEQMRKMYVGFFENTTGDIKFTNEQANRMADALFEQLGLDMNTAFNIFIHKALDVGDIPFAVTLNKPNKETIAAMLEAERISHDPDVKRYTSVDELSADLEKEDI